MTNSAAALLAGLGVLVACLAVWVAVLAVEGRRLEGQRDAATERLLAAWKEGYQVPPAFEEAPVAEEDPIPEFPPVLEEWLTQWDGDEARDKWRSRIRVLMVKHNANVKRVLEELESPAYG